jgi:uncharacterized membrane protein YvbJ
MNKTILKGIMEEMELNNTDMIFGNSAYSVSCKISGDSKMELTVRNKDTEEEVIASVTIGKMKSENTIYLRALWKKAGNVKTYKSWGDLVNDEMKLDFIKESAKEIIRRI